MASRQFDVSVEIDRQQVPIKEQESSEPHVRKWEWRKVEEKQQEDAEEKEQRRYHDLTEQQHNQRKQSSFGSRRQVEQEMLERLRNQRMHEEEEDQSQGSRFSTKTTQVTLSQQQQQHQQQSSPSAQVYESRASPSRYSLQHRLGGSLKVSPERIGVIIAGWPNNLAIQAAKACVKRGYRILPLGICLNDSEDDRVDITDIGTVVLYRYGDSQLRVRLMEQLTLAEQKLDLFPILIDTSLNVDNISLYQQLKVPFVFETPADDLEQHQRAIRETESTKCFAVIAQRMDKHVAAVDSLLGDMARRFPGLFAPAFGASPSRSSSFEVKIKTSEGNDKVNRGVLTAMSDLTNKDITLNQVQHMSSQNEKERHGLMQDITSKEPHIKRQYELRNASNSCVFQFEQSVNATYECGEGVADSVAFIAQKANLHRSKSGGGAGRTRVFDILDVAQQNRFLTW